MHDKILLVDGMALLGSSSPWVVSFDCLQIETDVLVKGPIVDSIRLHFQSLWNCKSSIKIKGKKKTV